MSESISLPSQSAIDAHFSELSLLRRGSGVVYFTGEALYPGSFLGIIKHLGADFISMKIRNPKQRNVTCMIPKQRCLLVDLEPKSENGSPLSHRVRLRDPKPFVSRFFSLADYYRILCNTTKSVEIIGEKNRLRVKLFKHRSPFQMVIVPMRAYFKTLFVSPSSPRVE